MISITKYNYLKKIYDGSDCEFVDDVSDKSKIYTTTDGQGISTFMEDTGRVYITNLIKDSFEVRKNNDGCLSDFIVRPINSDKDWLKIQLKTTCVIGKYSFNMKRLYPDCLIICINLIDKNMWLFDGNKFDNTTSFIINKNIFENKIDSIELLSELFDYYCRYKLFELNETNIPLGLPTQTELEYRNLREEKLQDIFKFDYPDRSNLSHDFLINGLKIQEKVGRLKSYESDDDVIIFKIAKHNGGTKMQCYHFGDNQFYWLHFPDKKHFLLIPEIILVNMSYISTSEYKANGREIWIDNTKSYKDHKNYGKYVFDYDNIDVAKIKSLIENNQNINIQDEKKHKHKCNWCLYSTYHSPSLKRHLTSCKLKKLQT
jgi:hypothetical protein